MKSDNNNSYERAKNTAEKHETFTKQVFGMRRGNQYDFVKVERPEKDDDQVTASEKTMLIQVNRVSESSVGLKSEMMSSGTALGSPQVNNAQQFFGNQFFSEM